MNRIAICGLDCAACQAYQATKSNDLNMRQELARQWSTPEYIVLAEDVICDGCRAGRRLFRFCQECELRQCAIQRGVTLCAHCSRFPCEFIERAPAEVKQRLEGMQGES